MKSLFLLILLSSASLISHAQRKLLLIPYSPSTLKGSIIEFLQDLNRKGSVIIEYSAGSFEGDKIIELEGDETTVGSVLHKVLKGQKVRLLEHNNKIILVPSSDPFSIEHLLPTQFSFFGYLKEEQSHEPLVSATIYEPASQRGVVSNNQGYFNILLPPGKHVLEISYGGLQPVILELNIQGNMRKDVTLPVKNEAYSAVVIESETLAKDGSSKLSGDEIFSSGWRSDEDPLQSVYLFAGLQNASASFSGFQVRGGGVGENLFLLDGNPVYNPSHMLGAVSIVNPTVLKAIRLYKSDFPAKINGSLSSVLDVYTKEGHMNSWHGEANIGFLAGALTLEGPLVKNRVALMMSIRKSVPGTFYQAMQDGMSSGFYDAHLKMTTIVNPKNKLAFNFYKGNDQIKQTEKYGNNLHQWGNQVGSIAWSTMLGGRSFIKTSLNFSHFRDLGNYQYTLFNTDDDDDEDQQVETKYIGSHSFVQHYNLKSQGELYASRKMKFNIGFTLSQTNTNPFDNQINAEIEDDERGFSKTRPLYFEELAPYMEAEIKVSKKFFVKPGLHVNAYRLDSYNTISFQPRIYMAYRITPAHKIFTSFARMNQVLHLVTNPYAGINQDVWVPSTERLKPEESEIYNIGYEFRHLKTWKASVNSFYKRLMNVTNFGEGQSFFFSNSSWEENLESGKGRSYGMEFMVEKTKGTFFFHASYALSWSWRQFNSLNNGKEFPYKYDHRHAAALALTYIITPHLNMSGIWSFTSGNIYSRPGRVYTNTQPQSGSPGEDPLEDYDFAYHYSESSQYRAKNFQRYDLSLDYHSKKERRLYSAIKGGIYNVSGSADLYSYTLSGSLSSKSILIKTGANEFKVIPYLSYTLKF